MEFLHSLDRVKISPKDKVFEEVADIVKDVLQTRNFEFKIYEDFFNGGDAQKQYFTKYATEEDEEYLERLDQSVVVNKCRRTVLTGARALYGISPPERKMEDETAHIRMMDVWKYNKVTRGFFHLNLAKEINKFGFALVQNVYVDKRSGEDITYLPGPGSENTYTVKYKPQQSPLVIPLPDDRNNSEMGKVVRITMAEDKLNYMGVAVYNISTIEYISDEDWFLWHVNGKDFLSSTASLEGVREDVFFGSGFVNKNPYGDINTLFTLYRNSGESAFVLDGISDLADIIGGQSKLNESISDDGHVLSQNAFPILFHKGFTLPPDWKRGPAATIGSNNRDSDMKYVTLDTDMEASSRFQDRIERLMRELAGYSPIMDGDLRNIGQVRNLRGAMLPDIFTINEKHIMFSEGEMEHAAATLRMIEWHEGEMFENKMLDITFSEDYIPVDELMRAETKAIELRSGQENLREEIRRRHPELETESEIDEKVKETLELMRLIKFANEPQRQANGSVKAKENARSDINNM